MQSPTCTVCAVSYLHHPPVLATARRWSQSQSVLHTARSAAVAARCRSCRAATRTSTSTVLRPAPPLSAAIPDPKSAPPAIHPVPPTPAALSPTPIGVPDYSQLSGLGGLGSLGNFNHLGEVNAANLAANMQQHLSAQVRPAREAHPAACRPSRGRGRPLGWPHEGGGILVRRYQSEGSFTS